MRRRRSQGRRPGCGVERRAGFRGVGAPASWTLNQMSGLMALYDNRGAASSAQASIADRSTNGRTLTTAGTPIPLPRCMAFNAQPALAFVGADSQGAQDQAADTTTYWGPLHKAGIRVLLLVQIRDQQGGSTQLLGNSNNATSNINALSVYYDGTSRIGVSVTSVTAGGTTHVNALTAADVRPGDVCLIDFAHYTDKTWTLDVVREARDSDDSRTTLSSNGSYATTIDTGAPTYGLTMATRGSISAVFATCRIYAAAVVQINSNTANDFVLAKAYLAARTRFDLVTVDYDAALSGGDFAGSADFADSTHFSDAGHAKLAAKGILAEQAIATALGWASAKNRGVLSDSRFLGTGASVLGTTDFRAVLAAGPFSGSYAPIGYGPIDDGSGNANSKKHFARSAYVTRSQGAQLGHSPRSAHSASIDVFVNRSTGTHRSVDVWHVLLGINDGSGSTWDYEDEWCRLCEYIVAERQAFDGVTPHFIVYNEPITGSTTTGILQRMIRERNRCRSVVVRILRGLGCQVRYVNTNLQSYNH